MVAILKILCLFRRGAGNTQPESREFTGHITSRGILPRTQQSDRPWYEMMINLFFGGCVKLLQVTI